MRDSSHRIVFVLTSLGLLGATPGTAQTTAVCVVTDAGIEVIQANAATREALLSRRTFPEGPYAAGEPWYFSSSRIRFGGATYGKFGSPRVVGSTDIVPVDEYAGVPVFAVPGAPRPYEIVYVPERPGCQFQPYEYLPEESVPLGEQNLSAAELFEAGISFFQMDELDRAADAFRRFTERVPEHRDAWYNYANTLYASERFETLVPVAERLVELDPLNENSLLILAQAYRRTDRLQESLGVLEHLDALPYLVDDLEMGSEPGRAAVFGNVSWASSAERATPLRMRFTFYNEAGTLGAEEVTVEPSDPRLRNASFRVDFQHREQPLGYRYEVLD